VIVASLVLWSALTRQAAQAIEGRPPSLADGYRHGLRAFLPLLGAILLAGLLFTVVGFPLLMVSTLPLIAVGGFGGEGGTVVMVVLYMIIVFGLILAALAMLFAVPAAVVIERQGPWRAIMRSWKLARGAWLRVVGIAIITWLIVTLPTVGLYAIGLGTGMFAFDPGAQPNPVWTLIESSLSFLIGALTYPFWVTAVTLLYFDRRVRTEAYDLELATDELSSAG
jgi:hypothetical protein